MVFLLDWLPISFGPLALMQEIKTRAWWLPVLYEGVCSNAKTSDDTFPIKSECHNEDIL